MDDVLEKNIADCIRACKRKGTTGASIPCLKQIVPTTGLTMAPARFHNVFHHNTDSPRA